METNAKYKRRPFMSIPVAEAYFPASSIEQARAAIFRCLNRGEGIAVAFGGTGLGKTLLLRVLAEDFQRNDLVILAHSAPRSVKAFYQQLLLGFHQTWCGCDENESRLFTIDYLQKNTDQKIILLIDEAQRLTQSVMEELRVLLDLCNDGQVRFCLAMAGTSVLEEHLTVPRLTAFNQRIVCRAWLDSFTGVDTGQYIDDALSHAGPPVQNVKIEDKAKRQIHDLSQGVPRVVNQLCDALVYSLFGEKQPQTNLADADETVDFDEFFTIREEDVVKAWASLQQVSSDSVACSPNVSSRSTMQTPLSSGDSSEAVVEFGSLGDEDDEFDEKAEFQACNNSAISENTDDITGNLSPSGQPIDNASSSENTCDSLSEQDIEQDIEEPNETGAEETIEPQSENDLTFDRMIRERLLGDTADSLPGQNDSESGEKRVFDDTDEEFSELALTDTPSDDTSFASSDATFEVDFNGLQTEFRCDDSHVQNDDDLVPMADECLEELLSLEGEIGLEAGVVRQIRDIHRHLRQTRQENDPSGEPSRNPLAKLDFSTGKSNSQAAHLDRLAKNASTLTSKDGDEPKAKQFRSVFQQAYTKEKDK